MCFKTNKQKPTWSHYRHGRYRTDCANTDVTVSLNLKKKKEKTQKLQYMVFP